MSDLSKDLKIYDEKQAKIVIKKQLLLKEALNSGDVDSIYKAQEYQNNLLGQRLAKKDPFKFNDKGKALLIDPFQQAGSVGYFDKPALLSFPVLRNMSRAPIIRSIIYTRKEQVAEFCLPQADKYSKGFVIQKKKTATEELTGEDKELTDDDKREIDRLTEIVLNCGANEDIQWRADNFEVFIRKIVEDSLVLDQATFEVVQTRGRKPYNWYHVDGAMIRLADSYEDSMGQPDEMIDGYAPSYIQLYQGTIVAEWWPWELGFGIRNPQTSIYGNGYGRSELEDLVTTVSSMLNSDAYNAKFFRNGTAPKGALLIKKSGGLNKDNIEEFRREWNSQMVGVDNFHKTPILDAEHMEWMDLQKNNRDMEFSKYYEFLVKIGCAMYKISPEEVGFPIEGANGGGMGNAGAGRDKEREYSMDKGLKPLLRSVETWMNKWMMGPLTEGKWEFKFVGMNSESSTEEEDRVVKAVSNYMTLNEARALKGLDSLPDGDIVLNPVYAQAQMMAQQAEMGGEPQGDFAEEEDGPGGYSPPWGSEGDDNPMMKGLETDLDKFIEEQ